MKFSEMDFNKRAGVAGVQFRRDFPNGYGVSVIRHPGSYGYERGLYEAAVFHGSGLCYATPVTRDVEGNLDEAGVEVFVSMVEALPKYDGACSHKAQP